MNFVEKNIFVPIIFVSKYELNLSFYRSPYATWFCFLLIVIHRTIGDRTDCLYLFRMIKLRIIVMNRLEAFVVFLFLFIHYFSFVKSYLTVALPGPSI